MPIDFVSENDDVNALEFRALQTFCNGLLSRILREELLTRLRSYSFRNVTHQIVFNLLWELRHQKPDRIRELLPARLVRAGFPDFDLASYYISDENCPKGILDLVNQLIGNMNGA